MRKTNEPQGWMVWTEYAAATFREIRNQFGYNDDEILRSMGFKNLVSDFIGGRSRTMAEVPEFGKKTDFLMMSHDARLVVRSITGRYRSARSSAPEQDHPYIIANKDSFISKVLGMYSLQQMGMPKITMVIMTHTMLGPRKQTTHVYSLKGIKPGLSVPLYERKAGVPPR